MKGKLKRDIDLGDVFTGIQVSFVSGEHTGWRIEKRPGERPVIHATLSCRPFGECTVEMSLDLSLTHRPRARILRHLFDLSPTEARIAVRLAQGTSLRGISDDMGIAISTVRTHLRAVLAKTNANRQTELIALCARVAILFGTDRRCGERMRISAVKSHSVEEKGGRRARLSAVREAAGRRKSTRSRTLNAAPSPSS
jgi:DNA-binding CsgD family transcriptional regulator